VASIGLDKIVLRVSRNVEFFNIVNGVRKTHKHLTPIGPGCEYIPETPDAKMPLYLTEGQKKMLIRWDSIRLLKRRRRCVSRDRWFCFWPSFRVL
jgi:hypothetical protein